MFFSLYCCFWAYCNSFIASGDLGVGIGYPILKPHTHARALCWRRPRSKALEMGAGKGQGRVQEKGIIGKKENRRFHGVRLGARGYGGEKSCGRGEVEMVGRVCGVVGCGGCGGWAMGGG